MMQPLVNAIRVMGLRSLVASSGVSRFTQGTMRGFYTTRAIVALQNVGLLDALLQNPTVDVEAFAAERKLDARLLKALCAYLYERRILERREPRYALNRRNKALVTALSGPFYAVYAYQDVFHNLEALLTGEKEYGRDVTRHADQVAKGSGAAGKLLVFPMVADVVTRSGFRRVLDLGCGDATFLSDLCMRSPGLSAYGLDISPEAIADGRRLLDEKGLADRVRLLVGDIFAIDTLADLPRDIDAAISVYVLHEFHRGVDDRLVDLFGRFRGAFPGVPLIICEVVAQTPEDLRARPGGVMEIQLWHQLSNQALVSRPEWKAIFAKAGFTHIQEEYLKFARTAIFTVS